MHPIGSLVILTVFAKKEKDEKVEEKVEEKEKDENVEEGVYQIGADQAISVTCSSSYCLCREKGAATEFTFTHE